MGKVGGDVDLAKESRRPDRGSYLGLENLDGDAAMVFDVFSEEDSRHSTLAKLSLEMIAVGERGLESFQWVDVLVHGAISRTLTLLTWELPFRNARARLSA